MLSLGHFINRGKIEEKLEIKECNKNSPTLNRGDGLVGHVRIGAVQPSKEVVKTQGKTHLR